MTSKILDFGAVKAVILVGFAMALHILFRDLNTFGETFFGVSKAMLGDTALFDEFSGGRYDGVATFLLIVYLFIVTIMLLNLLVAILATAHTQVQDDVEIELRTSRALVFDHYRTVVEKDLLPAPFNLLELVLTLMVFIVMFAFCWCVDPSNLWKMTQRFKQHATVALGEWRFGGW